MGKHNKKNLKQWHQSDDPALIMNGFCTGQNPKGLLGPADPKS
jgi:hypothetical protein